MMFPRHTMLRAGGSVASLAAAIFASGEARADGFQANPAVVSGTVTFDRTPATSETVTIDSPRAVINWAPYDIAGTGPIDLLPAANSILFQAGSSLGSPQTTPYFVLNRIIPLDPSRSVVFNGTLTDSGTGGGLFFYSPGGIILSPTARFNVNSLLLSTADVAVDGAGEFIPGGTSFSVSGTAGSTALIDIQGGAQINAPGQGSFVVAVAPRINQNGLVNVNGTTVLAAAQSADFTYNAGLFDVTVTQGTDASGNVLTANGSTGGPASSGAGDAHRVYLVAIPKNDAVTMFLAPGGNLGFDIAGAADVVGNAIVLSAGHNVTEATGGTAFAQDPVNATPATILGNGNFTSSASGRASASIFFNAGAANPLTTASDLFLSAPNVLLGANPGGTLSIGGTLGLFAIGEGGGTTGTSRTGGTANFFTSVNATSTVNGTVIIDASGFGDVNSSGAGSGGNGSGGSAQISVSGGTLTINGSAFVRANGTGGGNTNGSGAAGNSFGGNALVFSHDESGVDGLMTINGDVEVTANANDTETVSAGIDGGNAIAGQATLISNFGGAMIVTGNALVEGRAQGGENLGGGDLTGGTATGSSFAQISSQKPGASLVILGSATVDASAIGGASSSAGGAGGIATGGTAAIGVNDSATLEINGTVAMYADGRGGNGAGSAAGGNGTGGSAISAPVTGGIMTLNGPTILLRAVGVGGSGSAGGQGRAGNTNLVLQSGARVSITAADLVLDSTGFGGAASLSGGGAGIGGTANISAGDNAIIALAQNAILYGGAFGGAAASPASGGNATGGSARMFVNGLNGQIDLVGDILLDSSALGGNGVLRSANPLSVGGNATGGSAEIAHAGTAANGSIDIGGTATLLSSATGGTGSNGGNAASGAVFVSTQRGGTLSIGGTGLTIDASANGGAGDGGNGGAATTSAVNVAALSDVALGPSTLTAGTIAISTRATGGAGGEFLGATGRGGNATAGDVFIIAQQANGRLQLGDISIDAQAIGGAGGAGSSIAADTGKDGGNATSGGINVGVASGPGTPTPSGQAIFGDVFVNAFAIGGAGGTGNGAGGGKGGDALAAGFATILARGGIVSGGDLVLFAGALGGAGGAGTDGGAGGSATGGSAGIRATGHFVTGQPATVSMGALTAEAGATGGDGGAASGGTPGAGGAAQGGTAEVFLGQSEGPGAAVAAVTGNVTISGPVTLSASGFGGNSARAGGIGRGGTSQVTADRGALSFLDTVLARADGVSGNGRDTLAIATSGTGGAARASANAGSLIFGGTLDLLARGIGSGGLSGADASGGTAELIVSNGGTAAVPGTVTIFASASGGDAGVFPGSSGSGGTATGGTAQFQLSGGGSITTGTNAIINADAFGGDGRGTGSAGGVATGGLAQGLASNGTLAIGGNAQISASAVGGSGAAGGNATGGTAQLIPVTGGLSVSGTADLQATAAGGAALAGLGGRGGDATGGSAFMSAGIGATSNVPLSAGAITLDTSATGGAGGSGAAGIAGGRGGDGTGGTVRSGSATTAGAVTLGAAILAATGTGGSGGAGGTGAAGGAGGTGRGGTAGTGTDSSPTPATGSVSWLSVLQDVRGFGGAGGAGSTGGNGGLGQGGFAALGPIGGTVTVSGAVTQIADGSGGAAASGGTGGTGQGGTSFTGTAPHPVSGQTSSATLGAVSQSASGTGGAGAVAGQSLFGRNRLSASGGSLTIASLNAAASGTAAPNGQAASGITAFSGGSIQVAGNLSYTMPGDSVLAVDSGTITIAGTLDFVTGGNVVPSLVATPPISPGTATAQSISIQAGGNIDSFTSFGAANGISVNAAGGGIKIGNLTAGSILSLTANGPIATGTVSAVNLIQLLSSVGSISSAGIRSEDDVDINVAGSVSLGAVSAGDSVQIVATGAITTGNIDAGIVAPSASPGAAYRVGLSAPGGVTTGSIVARSGVGIVASAGGVQTGAIQTSQGGVGILSANGITTGGITTPTGASGVVYLANASMAGLLGPGFDPAPLFGAAPVRAPGAIAINGAVTTGELVAAATNAISIQGAVSAARALRIDTAGVAGFGGASVAPLIAVQSGDLQLGAGSSLGDATTTALTLVADDAATAIAIGGAGSAGYSIDVAEMARLRAQTITISPRTSPAPVTIGSFTLQGSGTQANLFGANGSLSISTGGPIRVVGAAQIENAAPGTTLRLVAGGRVEVPVDSGGRILLRGSASGPGGILDIQAASIWSATGNILSQLALDPAFAGRDTLLGRSPFAVATPTFSAQTIRFATGDSLYIQNTGNALFRSGFEAGSGGLAVSAFGSGTTPVEMVINGTALSSTGETLVNRDTAAVLLLPQATDPRPLTTGSSVNGCTIGASVCLVAAGDPVVETAAQSATEPQALIEAMDDAEREQANDAVEKSLDVRLSRIVNTNAVTSPSPIGEPVTGSGNPALWVGDPQGGPQ